jgi:hypothetical protein
MSDTPKDLMETVSMHEGLAAAPLQPSGELPVSFGNGRYQVTRRLGEGGQKWVYLGRDASLEREVVISVLRSGQFDPARVSRLRREAMTMARFGAHPNIVTVFDIGDEQGQTYVITEFVEGGSVADLLERNQERPLPLEQILQFTEQLAGALQHAHAAGIVHRDVKPANVWLTREGTVKLGDFGLASATQLADPGLEGGIVGTPHYMAPEQAQGNPPNPQNDVYALGVMVYEMATGRLPFRAADLVGIISQHVHTAPVAPSWHNGGLPKALETLILRLLSKKPEDRPDAGTVAKQARVIASSSAARMDVAAHRDETSLSRLAEGVFVGREQIMASMRQTLNEAISGQVRLLLLTGEAGSGKTRICTQLATYAGLRGVRVLIGQCYEGEGAPAFWPWLQIVREYCKELSAEQLAELLGPAAGDIAQLVPEVRDKLPDVAPPPALEPDKARFRFFDSVATFLRNASRRQPLMLTLDDLHWADPASLLLLEFLGRELAGNPVLLVGTYRDAEVGRQHPLTRTLGQLVHLGVGQRISLEGLTPADITQYIEMTSGVEPSEALVVAAYRQTGGNALFLTEVVRLLVSEGRLRDLGQESNIYIPIPLSVREVIHRRVNGLSPECYRLLTTASVIGRNFSLAVLEELQQLPEDELLDLLEQAASTRVIREVEGRSGEFSFSHALIRDTLYEQLSATRRSRLHLRIAQAIEHTYAGALDQHLSALAYHFSQAPFPDNAGQAIEYSLRAAERATSQLAYEESASLYQRAVDAVAQQPGQELLRCELMVSLGEAQQRASLPDRSRATLEQAAEMARQAGSGALLARAVLAIVPTAIGVRYGQPDPVLIDLLEDALRGIDPGDSGERARLLAQLSLARYHAPNEERLTLSQEAVDMARRTGGADALLPALYSRSIALMGFEKAGERLDVASEMVRTAEMVHNKEMALRGHYSRFRELLELGERPALDEVLERYGVAAEELRQPAHSWMYPFGQSIIAMMEGRLDESESLATEAAAIGRRAQDANTPLFFAVILVTLRGLQGRTAEVLERVRTFIEEYPFIKSWHATLAKLYIDVDRLDDARRELDGLATHDFVDHPRDGAFVVGMALLSQVVRRLKDESRARLLYDLLLPFADRNVIIGTSAVYYGPMRRHLGLLTATLSRWEESEAHFDASMARCRAMHAPPFLAYNQLECAAMLLESGAPGKRAKATRLLREALDGATRMGMMNVKRDTELLIASHPDLGIDLPA